MAPQVRALAHKGRFPLAPRDDNNGTNVVDESTITKLSLPRTLPRPAFEVEMFTLLQADPNLTDVPVEYIRDCLRSSTQTMVAALQAVTVLTPDLKDGLAKELEIIINDTVSGACPTHMFAIHGDTPLARGQKRHVRLYPFHHLVMAVQCASLPALPPSRPDATLSKAKIPIVPLCLPSPEMFALLHSYLYTQDPATLLAALIPPCESNLMQLAAHTSKVHGLWCNACALGVVDPHLYDVTEAAWANILAAMQALT
ncbi:hypothetical protein B0H13DRAFT_2504695 [Mycena leptocephala]|nr:hypothetical protein B0H13DRAFT_2504695 [Mycena leptocephala]